ncbi:hypothetical protein [Pectobacterium sp. B1J-3]|uniref:hypothetical protein n=1 Tax=Pectobacterium sp. B1J-3 TaxID=3385371 RepID=UPI00390670CE
MNASAYCQHSLFVVPLARLTNMLPFNILMSIISLPIDFIIVLTMDTKVIGHIRGNEVFSSAMVSFLTFSCLDKFSHKYDLSVSLCRASVCADDTASRQFELITKH